MQMYHSILSLKHVLLKKIAKELYLSTFHATHLMMLGLELTRRYFQPPDGT